jgi:hypothetical protein
MATVQPYILLAGWIALGIGVGIVAVHTVFGVVRGVGAVWPLAFLFVLTGHLAAGLPGVVVGLLASAAVGWYVVRA